MAARLGGVRGQGAPASTAADRGGARADARDGLGSGGSGLPRADPASSGPFALEDGDGRARRRRSAHGGGRGGRGGSDDDDVQILPGRYGGARGWGSEAGTAAQLGGGGARTGGGSGSGCAGRAVLGGGTGRPRVFLLTKAVVWKSPLKIADLHRR